MPGVQTLMEVKPRLLVVDDEVEIARMLRILLENRGYLVQMVHSGEEALEALKQNNFDLMLLDIMMPGLDGYEVCRRIKEDPRYRFMPIIMLTAKDSIKDKVTGLELGADDYLSKPFNNAELLAKIKVMLRIKQMSQELSERNRELSALTEITAVLNQSLEPEQVLTRVLDKVLEVLGLETAILLVMDPAGKDLFLQSYRGCPERICKRYLNIKVGAGLTGKAVQELEPVVVDQLTGSQDEEWEQWKKEGYQCFASIPLRSQNRTFGVINLAGEYKAFFNPQEVQLLKNIGHQLGVALENSSLFREVKETVEAQSTLLEISQMLLSSTTLDAMMMFIFQQAFNLVRQADRGGLLLYDKNREGLVVKASAGFDHAVLSQICYKPGEAIPGKVFQNKVPLLLSSRKEVKEANQNISPENKKIFKKATQGELVAHSAVCVPIILHEVPIGCITLANFSNPQPFSSKSVVFLQSLANQAAIALENARLLEESQKRAQDFEAFYEVGKTLTSTLDIKEILSRITEAISGVVKAKATSLMVYHPEWHSLEVIAGHNLSPEYMETSKKIRDTVEESPSLKAIAEKKAVAIADIKQDPIFAPWREVAAKEGYRAFITIPLVLHQQATGVINVYLTEVHPFTEEEIKLLHVYANQAAIAVENARLYETTLQMAITDELTQLNNRRSFYEKLEEEVRRFRRYRRPFSLLMMDLDHFKEYNDEYGHLAGDEVLRQLGIILKANSRDVDIVARYGGEEFAVILHETNLEHALAQAERLRVLVQVQLKESPEIMGWGITVSIGVGTWNEDMKKPEGLVSVADKALFLAKSKGRNRCCSMEDVK
jgi:diguanylate cyclase (GGDEF)-like protein